jgi:hypothetical protein
VGLCNTVAYRFEIHGGEGRGGEEMLHSPFLPCDYNKTGYGCFFFSLLDF